MKNGLQASGRGTRGTVRMAGARIDGELDASSAEISNSTGPAISARNLHVGETIYLSDGFIAQGEGEIGAVHLTAVAGYTGLIRRLS